MGRVYIVFFTSKSHFRPLIQNRAALPTDFFLNFHRHKTFTTTYIRIMNNESVKWGVILGGISVAITLILYIINAELLAASSIGFGIMAVSIGFMVYAGIVLRRVNGGYISFGEIFKGLMIVTVVSSLISILFQYVLHNFIDPDLAETLNNAVIKNTTDMMAKFGTPEDVVEQTIEQMKADLPIKTSLGAFAKNFGFSVAGSAVVSLIIAAILKKNEPMEG
jgi:Protein of unknown function (DUF4199)